MPTPRPGASPLPRRPGGPGPRPDRVHRSAAASRPADREDRRRRHGRRLPARRRPGRRTGESSSATRAATRSACVDGDAVEVALPDPRAARRPRRDGEHRRRRRGRRAGDLLLRRRVARADRASSTAGAGPSHVVAADDGRFYVTDTGGDALLVYERPRSGAAAARSGERARQPLRDRDRRAPRSHLGDGHRAQPAARAGDHRPRPEARRQLPDRAAAQQRRRRSSGPARSYVVGRDDGDVQIIDPERDREVSRLERLGELVEESEERAQPPAARPAEGRPVPPRLLHAARCGASG